MFYCFSFQDLDFLSSDEGIDDTRIQQQQQPHFRKNKQNGSNGGNGNNNNNNVNSYLNNALRSSSTASLPQVRPYIPL